MEVQQLSPTSEESTIHLILIVEGDGGVGDFLTEALAQSRQQYRVAWVTSAIDALKVTKFLYPSLFLLDFHLTDVNAITLYDLLHSRKELSHVPAIIVSTRLECCQREIQARKIHGLSLPLELDTLLQTVEEALNKKTD